MRVTLVLIHLLAVSFHAAAPLKLTRTVTLPAVASKLIVEVDAAAGRTCLSTSSPTTAFAQSAPRMGRASR